MLIQLHYPIQCNTTIQLYNPIQLSGLSYKRKHNLGHFKTLGSRVLATAIAVHYPIHGVRKEYLSQHISEDCDQPIPEKRTFQDSQ